jgi:hypothetical protein
MRCLSLCITTTLLCVGLNELLFDLLSYHELATSTSSLTIRVPEILFDEDLIPVSPSFRVV